MAFNVKKRGKLTYYYHGDHPVLSALVTEELPDGDLKISFAGLTGGYSAKGVLGLDELVSMEPEKEIPLVFKSWEAWLIEAGICDSLEDVDLLRYTPLEVSPNRQTHWWTRLATPRSSSGSTRPMPKDTGTSSGIISPITECQPGLLCIWWTCRTRLLHTNFMGRRSIRRHCRKSRGVMLYALHVPINKWRTEI